MKLEKFLVMAKKNTYASGGEKKEKRTIDGGKFFSFKADSWSYFDRYYGFNPFIGEEVVWKNRKLVWGMNYYGGAISDRADAKELYAFLRQALALVKISKPFRGPNKFSNSDWKYVNQGIGTVSNFSGTEMIYFKNKKVYALKYHGGFIKS